MESILLLIKGLLNNLLIAAGSAVLPLVVGILLSLLVKKHKRVGNATSWLMVPLESICVPVWFSLIYYGIWSLNIIDPVVGSTPVVFLVAIGAFSLSYLLYIPSRYNCNWSFLKNTLYNGLGLLSALLKWSFVAGLFRLRDVLDVSLECLVARADFAPMLLTAVCVTGALLVLNLGRAMTKEFLK